MKKQTQQGFTLIELMIVIAIVGILAALALPAYQQYTVRSKIGEALAYGAEAKTTISEHFATKSTFPTNNTEAGVEADIGTDIVKSVKINNGLITLSVSSGLANDIGDGEFLLSPVTAANNRLEWTCKKAAAGTLPSKYLPSSCR